MTGAAQAEREAGPVSAGEIRRTYQQIRPYLRRTPTLTVPLDALTGAGHDDAGPGVVLKLEQLQCAGSFKTRGAFANLLLREIPPAGVIAACGGNHGVAVAYAAHRLGIPATIFVPAIAGRAKMDAIRSLGAGLHIFGDRYADAWAAAQTWAAESGAIQVPAFDQPETILGQGSVGLELSEQVSGLDTVLVPVGGGGRPPGTTMQCKSQDSCRPRGRLRRSAVRARQDGHLGRPGQAPERRLGARSP